MSREGIDRCVGAEMPWTLSAAPVTCSAASGWHQALVRRWCGTEPVMVQPPLDEHYVVLHLGGVKKIERRRDGPTVSTIADEGALTLVPAGTAFTWLTTGPIAFAHLYLPPHRFEATVDDVDERGVQLVEHVAVRDPILEPLFREMLAEFERPSSPSTIRLDALFESFVVRLALRYGSRPRSRTPRALALAPHRLRRVLDYIDNHLEDDISLNEIVVAAGSSQFHFSHAFRIAMGVSPYRYLINQRIELAKTLLMTSPVSLAEVSLRCGFNSGHQFSVMFKQQVGIGPKRYRSSHC